MVCLSRMSGHEAELVGTFLSTFILVDCGGPRSNAVDRATQVSQQNKAMDALSARVAAVPGIRAADLGTLRDPNQARSLGRKHWPSKQGVLARSIGRASKESRPDSLVEQ